MPSDIAPLQLAFAIGGCAVVLVVGIALCCRWRLPHRAGLGGDGSTVALLGEHARRHLTLQRGGKAVAWPYGDLHPVDVQRITDWLLDVHRTTGGCCGAKEDPNDAPHEETDQTESERVWAAPDASAHAAEGYLAPTLRHLDAIAADPPEGTASQCATYSPRVSALSSNPPDVSFNGPTDPLRR